RLGAARPTSDQIARAFGRSAFRLIDDVAISRIALPIVQRLFSRLSFSSSRLRVGENLSRALGVAHRRADAHHDRAIAQLLLVLLCVHFGYAGADERTDDAAADRARAEPGAFGHVTIAEGPGDAFIHDVCSFVRARRWQSAFRPHAATFRPKFAYGYWIALTAS